MAQVSPWACKVELELVVMGAEQERCGQRSVCSCSRVLWEREAHSLNLGGVPMSKEADLLEQV